MDITHKRDVIESVLKDYFTPTQLESVMAYWELNYSREPAFVLQRFLKDVCTTDELKMSRAIILQALVTELNELSVGQKAEEQAVDVSSLALCFDVFTSDLLERAKNGQAKLYGKFSEQLGQQIQQQFQIAVETVQAWTAESSPLRLPDSDLPVVVSVIYELLCDWYGPVDADTILSVSISLCKQQGYADEIARLI